MVIGGVKKRRPRRRYDPLAVAPPLPEGFVQRMEGALLAYVAELRSAVSWVERELEGEIGKPLAELWFDLKLDRIYARGGEEQDVDNVRVTVTFHGGEGRNVHMFSWKIGDTPGKPKGVRVRSYTRAKRREEDTGGIEEGEMPSGEGGGIDPPVGGTSQETAEEGTEVGGGGEEEAKLPELTGETEEQDAVSHLPGEDVPVADEEELRVENGEAREPIGEGPGCDLADEALPCRPEPDVMLSRWRWWLFWAVVVAALAFGWVARSRGEPRKTRPVDSGVMWGGRDQFVRIGGAGRFEVMMQ